MILGLTGGIATGKSTVGKILIKKGYKVVDADIIAREVAKDKEVLDKISKCFGCEMIKDGSLDRSRLREHIFKDKNKVDKLNAIMHPPIIERLKSELDRYRDESLLIADIPLLFESKLEYLVDDVLLVYCHKDIQIERLMQRDRVDREAALDIISKQMPLELKKQKSRYIIENNMDIESLEIKVEEFFIKLNNRIKIGNDNY